MNDKPIKVLLIEDDEKVVQLIGKFIAKSESTDFELVHAGTLATGLERLSKEAPDVILLDLGLPDSQELVTFNAVQEHAGNTPIVILTAFDDEETGFNAVKAGAQNYLIKGRFSYDSLALVLRYSIERQRLKTVLAEQTRKLQESLGRTATYAVDLEASEARFRNIITENADGIIIVNREGIVQFVNPAVEALFGRQSKDFLGEMFGFPVVGGERTEVDIVTKDNQPVTAEIRVVEIEWKGETVYLASLRDITERKIAEEEKTKLISELQDALTKIETLSGLIPICAWCKKIRDDEGYWKSVENYIEEHSKATFTHGMCTECAKKVKMEYRLAREWKK